MNMCVTSRTKKLLFLFKSKQLRQVVAINVYLSGEESENRSLIGTLPFDASTVEAWQHCGRQGLNVSSCSNTIGITSLNCFTVLDSLQDILPDTGKHEYSAVVPRLKFKHIMVRPGAPSSVLAPSSDALCSQ